MRELTRQQQDVLTWGLYELGLTERVVNHLNNIGIVTVEELLMTPRARLLNITNVGEKTLKEIFKCLSKHGLGPTKPL